MPMATSCTSLEMLVQGGLFHYCCDAIDYLYINHNPIRRTDDRFLFVRSDKFPWMKLQNSFPVSVHAKVSVKPSFADNKTDEEVAQAVEAQISSILGSIYPVNKFAIKYTISREQTAFGLKDFFGMLRESQHPRDRADIYRMLNESLQKAIDENVWVLPTVAEELRNLIFDHEDSQIVIPLAYDAIKKLNIILEREHDIQVSEALECLADNGWFALLGAESDSPEWTFLKDGKSVHCVGAEELIAFSSEQEAKEPEAETDSDWKPIDSAPRDRYVLVTGYVGNEPSKGRFVSRAKWSYGNWYMPGECFETQRLHPPTHWKETGTLPQ